MSINCGRVPTEQIPLGHEAMSIVKTQKCIYSPVYDFVSFIYNNSNFKGCIAQSTLT